MWRRDRRGAILLLIALTTVGLMGLMVLALDGGILQREKRKAQAAADAGAQAGAMEILRARTDLTHASARSEVTRNGFTNRVANDSVGVWYPNTAIGTHTGSSFVGVLVLDTVTTLFGSFLGRGQVVISARSVGGVTGTTQNCLTILDQSVTQALKITSGASVRAVSCNISVNSDDPSAMYIANSSLVADGIGINGGYTGKSYSIDANGAAAGTPPPTTGAQRATDPLASFVSIQNVSDTLGCPGVTNPNPGNSLAINQYRKVIPSNGDVLNPGIYCGGINISSDNIVRFNPGLFVIKGFGLVVSSGGQLFGNGPVNIVNLNGVGGQAASDFAGFTFASDAVVNLTAATDRPGLVGILFYSPLGQGIHLPEENSIQSSGVGQLNGSLYFPDQLLHVGSGGSKNPATLTINGGVVAKRVEFLADARVDITGFGGASPYYSVRRASVVE